MSWNRSVRAKRKPGRIRKKKPLSSFWLLEWDWLRRALKETHMTEEMQKKANELLQLLEQELMKLDFVERKGDKNKT